MKIFVAFGYNADDKWIKDLVFPLIQSFDGTVITGEDIYGLNIPNAVSERIRSAEGLIAFLTRRDKLDTGKYTSHQWVSDELATAIGFSIPVIEVREKEVSTSGGIASGRQYIVFELEKKAELMVELAKALSEWRKDFVPKRIKLLPDEIVQEVRPFIRGGQLDCKYQFLEGNKPSKEYATKPYKIGQGLCIDVIHVPSEESLIQVMLSGPGFSWTSGFEPVKLLTINLQRD